jgi:hypothetical protein
MAGTEKIVPYQVLPATLDGHFWTDSRLIDYEFCSLSRLLKGETSR